LKLLKEILDLIGAAWSFENISKGVFPRLRPVINSHQCTTPFRTGKESGPRVLGVLSFAKTPV
jgi:hypothetical protein